MERKTEENKGERKNKRMRKRERAKEQTRQQDGGRARKSDFEKVRKRGREKAIRRHSMRTTNPTKNNNKKKNFPK